jgi:uncharacterized SAM-binding protein YcdF (DUF218 family)
MKPSVLICRLLCWIALFWLWGLMWFITLIPTAPTRDSLQADAIVALTGGSLRVEHAFELLAEGKADKLFISGVENGVTLGALLKSKEYKPFADHLPAGSVIALGHKARSTIGNAEETGQWMAEEHVHTIRLVTGNYHMPRAILELHEVAPDIAIIAEPVFPKHFSHNAWWQWSDSIKLVLSEYHKYVASSLVHALLVKT